MSHGINRHVLTGANTFINNGIHPLLKHGFVTFTMSYQGHRINLLFLRKLQVYRIGKEGFSYRWGNAKCNSMPKGSLYV